MISIRKHFKRQFYQKLNDFTYWYDLKRRAEFVNKRGSIHGYAEITSKEKQEIKQVWGEYGGKYHAFGFYKQFCGVFNPYYVPDDFFDFAEQVLNLRWAAYFLQHKCNLKHIIPSKNRAKVIVQKIDGHFVLEDNTEISKEAAIVRLKGYPCFMRKVARGTGGGKGVRKIALDGVKYDMSFFDELLQGNDIEFEEVIQQNDFLAQFNPDSVNTFRFLTLNINQKCTLLSTFLRMGSKGSYVDNLSGGAGVLVGINQDGYLNSFGIDKHFEKKYVSPMGGEFKGIKVPDFDNITQQIISFHKKIPYANLIGWDVTIDNEGNPIVVELNLDNAIIEAHQVFNGPVFGDRLAEVKEYVENRKPTLWHKMMIY
jgi:hypothetical protein